MCLVKGLGGASSKRVDGGKVGTTSPGDGRSWLHGRDISEIAHVWRFELRTWAIMPGLLTQNWPCGSGFADHMPKRRGFVGHLVRCVIHPGAEDCTKCQAIGSTSLDDRDPSTTRLSLCCRSFPGAKDAQDFGTQGARHLEAQGDATGCQAFGRGTALCGHTPAVTFTAAHPRSISGVDANCVPLRWLGGRMLQDTCARVKARRDHAAVGAASEAGGSAVLAARFPKTTQWTK